MMRVPCGRCVGCRYDRAIQWAVRCEHEAMMHDQNCFVTLTYDPDKRDKRNPYTLQPKHFRKFIRDARYHFSPKKVRYLHCGEYGEKGPGHHPHYHALLFGVDFEDKEEARELGDGLFKSKTLQRLWPFGFSSIGDVTFDSAAYVAGYCTKKITGEQAEEYYKCVCRETGEVLSVLPEYATMSRRPGIGESFFREYYSDVFPHDEVIINGKSRLPPRYYDKLLKEKDEKEFERIKRKRIEVMSYWSDDQTDERLEDREKCMKARQALKQKKF